MSLAVAVPLGVASAAVYGTSIVVQHRVSHRDGEENIRGLLNLARHPVWLLAISGDVVGFILSVAALSHGPVVLIQPLVVIMLPVALVASWAMGGPRPHSRHWFGAIVLLGGLAIFLMLIGEPGHGRTPKARYVAITILAVLATAAILSLLARGRHRLVRGACYGVAAGVCFGTLGVMVNAASNVVDHRGLSGMVTTGRGLVPLVGILVLGLVGIAVTQVSFQVAGLPATLPANLAADPFAAVVIGLALLRQDIPLDALHLLGYLVGLVAVIGGAVVLANVTADPVLEPS